MPHLSWIRLAPLAVAAALVVASVPSRADPAPLRLTLMEKSADGICLYEAARNDMLVAVFVREKPSTPPCKPELTLS